MKRKMIFKKKTLIILLIMLIPLLSFVALNSKNISSYFANISRQLYLASVDVSNLDVSTLIIDNTDNYKRYTDSFVWNATDINNFKSVIYQVNYKQNNTANTYKAGDLEITVPNLLKQLEGADPSYYYNSTQNFISISADEESSTNKTYDWSYHYSSDYSKIIFVNNTDLEMNNSFEGSIQVAYKLTPVNIESGLTTTFKTTLNSKESNTISFSFTSTNSTYSFSHYNFVPDSYEGLPSGDYIYVEQSYSLSKGKGVKYLYPSTSGNNAMYIEFDVPSDFKMYTDTGKELSKKNNKYYYAINTYTNNTSNNIYSSYIYTNYSYVTVYMAIPKTEYFDKTISYTYSLYGTYTKANKNNALDSGAEQELVYQKSNSLKVSSYEFHYSGDSFDIHTYSGDRYKQLDPYLIEKGLEIYDTYTIGSTNYTGTTYDYMMGIDLFLYHDSDGSIRYLNDNEYYFSYIDFPYSGVFFDNPNGKYIPDGKYDVDLYVRYENETDYTLFETFKNTGKSYRTSSFPKKVTAYYFLIHNVVESIDSCWSESTVTFNSQNVTTGSSIIELPFLKIYKNGVLANATSDSSYSSSILKNYVQPFDQSHHGSNIQRYSNIINVADNIDMINNEISVQNFTGEKDKYNSKVEATISIGKDREYNYWFSDNFKGYETYIFMPKGVYYDNNKSILQSTLIPAAYASNFKLKDGANFANLNELDDFFRNHQTIEVINDYNNTGRQLIKIISNFSDTPLDNTFYKENHSNGFNLYKYEIPVYTTKDAVEEFGDSAKFILATKPVEQRYTKQYSSATSYKDEYDFNGDGNTTEYVRYDTVTKTILIANAYNQDIVTYVETNKDPFTSYAANTSLNTNYTYKLRTRNLNNKITNLVIYDSLEAYEKVDGSFINVAGDKTTFKGTLVGIDTSYAESKGYNVKTYYSENEQPSKLGVDSSWKVYSTSVNSANVKSLAFEFLDSSNNRAVLPEDTLMYVEVIMKAPAEAPDGAMTTFNASWSEWNAIDDSNNIVTPSIELNSTITGVTLPGIVKTQFLEAGTDKVLSPEITKEYIYGAEYTTSKLVSDPEGYIYKEQKGDEPSGNISKANYVVKYYYEKADPQINITGSIDNNFNVPTRTTPITYNIKVSVSYKYLTDRTTLTIVDKLPYEIDESKSSLNGGVYDSTKKTITWTITRNVRDFYGEEVEYNKTITVVYKDIPVINRKLKSTLTCNVTTYESLATVGMETWDESIIDETYKVNVKYLDNITNEDIQTPTVLNYHGGEAYTTIAVGIDGYELVSLPTNKDGIVDQEVTDVVYLYRKIVHTISVLQGDHSHVYETSIRNDGFDYFYTFNTSIKDYIGESTVTIVDVLPYELDLSKSRLDGGVYDGNNKTITWTETITTTSLEEKNESYNHRIMLRYKDIPITVNSITNKVICTLTSNGLTRKSEIIYPSLITEKYPVITKYLEYGTDKPVDTEDTQYYLGGASYTTSPKDVDLYELKSTPTNYQGTIESERTEVIYYYEKKDPVLSSSINSTGSATLDTRNGIIEYNISYNPQVKDYIGPASVKIEDHLPYEIDEEKSDIQGGSYNSANRTITWNDSFNIATSALMTKNYNYTIRLAFKDVDSTQDIANEVIGTITLSDRSSQKSTTYRTSINIPGTIKVKYIDVDTKKEIVEEVSSTDVINRTFIPSSKEIDGYYLVETPELESYTYNEEEQTIYYKYRRVDTKEEVVEEEPQTKLEENPATGIFDFIKYTLIVVGIIALVYINAKLIKKRMFRRV